MESKESDDNSEKDGEKEHCEAQQAPVFKAKDEITIGVHWASISESTALVSHDRDKVKFRLTRADVFKLVIAVQIDADVDDCITLEPLAPKNIKTLIVAAPGNTEVLLRTLLESGYLPSARKVILLKSLSVRAIGESP